MWIRFDKFKAVFQGNITFRYDKWRQNTFCVLLSGCFAVMTDDYNDVYDFIRIGLIVADKPLYGCMNAEFMYGTTKRTGMNQKKEVKSSRKSDDV